MVFKIYFYSTFTLLLLYRPLPDVRFGRVGRANSTESRGQRYHIKH